MYIHSNDVLNYICESEKLYCTLKLNVLSTPI